MRTLINKYKSMDFKSKITWINIISLVITILSALTGTLNPTQAVYVVSAVQILTVILRQLQGKTVLGVSL
jgi:hypothetical protein